MKYNLLKNTAIIVLITFFSMIVAPSHSHADAPKNDLEEAKKFYDEGKYELAVKAFDRFIDKQNRVAGYIVGLTEAYYYKAKIYFLSERDAELDKTLRNLYELNPKYGFPGERDADFLKKAYLVKKAWKQEKIEPGKEEPKKVIEKEIDIKKPKKFPWLLVAGVIVAGALAYFLLVKKSQKKTTLSVTVGEGVEGIPAAGTYQYKKGETVSYSYTLKTGYNVLSVKLDGNDVSPGGSIKMDQNHNLTVSASKKYTLTVLKKEGVDGTPGSGTYVYNEGETVPYNYTLQGGYNSLTVTVDGIAVLSSGTVTMNRDHTLVASSGKTYTLTVIKDEGVDGAPAGGTYTYSDDRQTVNYGYTLQNGYSNLVVTLDDVQVPATGIITMDKDHILRVSANLQYTLTVSRGAGVNGTPDSGAITYNAGSTVTYNYTLQEGYKDLVVTLDGNPVAASGTVTMDSNHTLSASATAILYTLSVSKGAGVIGTPENGIQNYAEGAAVNYSYSLEEGYQDLVVTLDGSPVSASGTITMNANHTLSASASMVGQYTLTVRKDQGVNGTPGTGTYNHRDGSAVSYDYTLKDGYKDLVVTLDGKAVNANGTIAMDKNHTLIATAAQLGQYTLTVTKGVGVDGTPNTGVINYQEGVVVNYSYTLQAGYQDLVVTVDGVVKSASGTVTMNANHTLTASAAKVYTLTVIRGAGVNGTPASGTTPYKEGDTVDYNYTLQSGYVNLVVTLDGNEVASNGTITMDGNHTLIASATKQWTLNVIRNDGIDGSPPTGAYTFFDGQTVSYSYSLQSGYVNLTVTLDGTPVAAGGTITMNSSHSLVASATAAVAAGRKNK